MSNPFPNNYLWLSEAIVTWNDPALIEDARAAERSCTRGSLSRSLKPRLVRDDELRQPTSNDWMGGDSSVSRLGHAWAALERSFRAMAARGELFLEGVLIKPSLTENYQPISGTWASDLKLDVLENRIIIQERRYSNVRVSRTPTALEVGGAEVTEPSAPSNWAFETLGEWSDDQVLALFEEHARRVVESESARLSTAYSKVSVMPIIFRKMKARFKGQENASSLKDEAIFLAEWIKQKAPSFQIPAVSTIEAKLRTDYQALKGRSKLNN